MRLTEKSTTDLTEIRQWVTERGAEPGLALRSGREEPTILFKKPSEHERAASWEEFFHIFEERNLAFDYQEHTQGGSPSTFHRFIERDTKKAGP